MTECDLDDVHDWDFLVNNNSEMENTASLEHIIDYIKENNFQDRQTDHFKF